MDQVYAEIDALFDHVVDVRRDLHAHPELSHDEHRTTALIRHEMSQLGLDEVPVATATGAVFTLEGARPGKTVLLRADIDALPITEYAGDSFISTTEGIMHACGHDGHVASLLGAATALTRHADVLSGRYVFLFQPAEEGFAGASAMIDGGILDLVRPDAAVGCHLASPAPVGLVGVKTGIAMADARSFTLTVAGLGGHGAAAPTEGNVIVALARLIDGLGGVATGLRFEEVECSCSAGIVSAGTAANVIPDRAHLRGTLRTFDDATTSAALERIDQLCTAVSSSMGVEVSVHYDNHTPAVCNDGAMAKVVATAAQGVVGTAGVFAMPPVTPSDDMSEFLLRIPGCYFMVGAGKADGSSGMHHHPGFAIDEASLAVAAKVLAGAAIQMAEGS